MLVPMHYLNTRAHKPGIGGGGGFCPEAHLSVRSRPLHCHTGLAVLFSESVLSRDCLCLCLCVCVCCVCVCVCVCLLSHNFRNPFWMQVVFFVMAVITPFRHARACILWMKIHTHTHTHTHTHIKKCTRPRKHQTKTHIRHWITLGSSAYMLRGQRQPKTCAGCSNRA